MLRKQVYYNETLCSSTLRKLIVEWFKTCPGPLQGDYMRREDSNKDFREGYIVIVSKEGSWEG